MLTLFNIPLKRMFVVALIVLMGCRESDKNSSLIFEELNESLERSNKVIGDLTKAVLFDLEGKTLSPETAERAFVWFSAADSIYNKGAHLIAFLEGLKSNFKQGKIEIGPRSSNELYQKLITLKAYLSGCTLNFKSQYMVNAAILDEGIKGEAEFYKANFIDRELQEKCTALLRIENNILVIINSMITYCNAQVSSLRWVVIEKFQAIAASNSSVFKRGQEMIIQAGVGEFDIRSNPSFEINGLNVQPNENGVGEYKMKIKNGPGDYKVHVKIKYTTIQGKKESLEKDIEYTVVQSPPNDKQVQVSDTTMSP